MLPTATSSTRSCPIGIGVGSSAWTRASSTMKPLFWPNHCTRSMRKCEYVSPGRRSANTVSGSSASSTASAASGSSEWLASLPLAPIDRELSGAMRVEVVGSHSSYLLAQPTNDTCRNSTFSASPPSPSLSSSAAPEPSSATIGLPSSSTASGVSRRALTTMAWYQLCARSSMSTMLPMRRPVRQRSSRALAAASSASSSGVGSAAAAAAVAAAPPVLVPKGASRSSPLLNQFFSVPALPTTATCSSVFVGDMLTMVPRTHSSSLICTSMPSPGDSSSHQSSSSSMPAPASLRLLCGRP
mmetsp:Transcript_18056/g.63868  ORF Transcript_18056/g.63868 Transcript_18056/m.63868 type:complete len:299 (-) Transcript_18056:793-1689(-)